MNSPIRLQPRLSTTLRLGLGAVLAALLVAVFGSPATAHPSPWSNVLVSTTGTQVVVVAHIPISEYELATGTTVTATEDGVRAASTELTTQAERTVHLDVDGTEQVPTVESVTLGRAAGYPAFVIRLAVPITTPPETLGLTWLLVNEQVPSHKAYVTFDHDGSKRLVGVLTSTTPSITLLGTHGAGTEASNTSLASMVTLGLHHIAGGYDHLLFLTMLLLPAPLVARRRRRGGQHGHGLVHTGKRVALIATAFTLGHSLTLAVISLGWVHVPAKPIEILVAVSIVVAGLHAVRPLLAGGEPVIAALFGLVHGGAFATTILELDLSRGDTLRAVLGFNIGIELAQLVVIACVVPLLYLASASPDYKYLVAAVAALGSTCAADWIVALLRGSDPVFQPVFEQLSEHPLLTWAGLAMICVSMYATRALAINARAPGSADRVRSESTLASNPARMH